MNMRLLYQGVFTKGLPLVLLTMISLSSGCAMFSGRLPSVEDLETAGVKEVSGERSFAFGHGSGQTREDARQAAREQLAAQLLVQVRSEMRSLERELHAEESGEVSRQSSREFSSSMISSVNVELEGIEVDQEAQGRDGWYVRMRVPADRMEQLRDRARKNAPALARVEATESAPKSSPGRKLRSALRGLAVIHERGLADAGVFAGSERTTFEAYFLKAVEENVERLRALPLVDGRRIRFVVIDRITHKPQPGFVIEVAGRELVTDRDGYTAWLNPRLLPKRVEVLMLGYSAKEASDDWRHPDRAWLLSESFAREKLSETQDVEVLVYTKPAGAVVQLGQSEAVSPGVLRVSSGRHQLSANLGEAYRSEKRTITIPEGPPYAYVALQLTERRFGRLNLEVDDDRSRLKVTAPNLGYDVVTEGNSFDRDVEAGHYEVLISHESDDDYQKVRDSLVVLEDKEFRRVYNAPRYREPYRHGNRISWLGFRFGGKPGEGYEVPWVQGREIEYAEIANVDSASSVAYDSTNVDLIASYQHYFNSYNTTLQGAIGLRNHDFTVSQSDEDVPMSLQSKYASVGAGFWQSFLGDRLVASLTINQVLEYASWQSDSRAEVQVDEGGEWEQLPTNGVSNNYRLVELGAQWDLSSQKKGLGLTFSLGYPLETMEPYITIGFGFLNTTSGYRYPESVQAEEGINY